MATPSPTDMIGADELPGRERTHINGGPIDLAVLDDYQHAALSLADWSSLKPWASITIFHDHLADGDSVVARLKPFDVVRDAGENAAHPRHFGTFAEPQANRVDSPSQCLD